MLISQSIHLLLFFCCYCFRYYQAVKDEQSLTQAIESSQKNIADMIVQKTLRKLDALLEDDSKGHMMLLALRDESFVVFSSPLEHP